MGAGREWWRGAVIYQIYPRSFFDSNGDGIGDLKGITQKLDYVAALGVDAVWLSPFFTSPMADFGYDVADYRDVDPIFGTLKDCDAMIEAMHKRGLKLIIDLVLNHTSDRHPWFIESRKDKTNPKADWYVWADPKPDGAPPNNWISVFGGPAWEFDTGRGQYYFHQFLKSQPDLNFRNPAVEAEMLATAKWWLERGVDGFRMDALPHCIHHPSLQDNPPAPPPVSDGKSVIHPYSMQIHKYDKSQPEMIPFLKKFRKLTDQYPDRMMVAENGSDGVDVTVAYTNGPEMLHTAYDFTLLRHSYSPDFVRQTIDGFFAKPHGAWPSWALSNHDAIRVASRWAAGGKSSPAQAKMLIAMVTSLRGSSFIYQGEELGLTEAGVPPEKRKDPGIGATGTGRDGCRTPLPWDGAKKNAGFTTAAEGWLPVPPEHAAMAVVAQDKDAASVLNFTRNFLKWRKNHPALLRGDLKFGAVDDKLLSFTRTLDGESIFCAFNFSPDTVTFKPQGTPLEGHGLGYTTQGDTVALPGFGGFFAKKAV